MIKQNKTGDISVNKIPTKLGFLLSLCLLLSTTNKLMANEPTTVYKAIAKDGSISFSDEAEHGSEAITVKPIATIPAMDIKQNKTLNPQKTSSAEPYQSLTIVSPGNDTALNSGSGNVQVVVKSIPGLRRGHLFSLELDGVTASTQQANTFTLNAVDRGTHTLTIKILDSQQQTLKAAISTMTIHRPSKRS